VVKKWKLGASLRLVPTSHHIVNAFFRGENEKQTLICKHTSLWFPLLSWFPSASPNETWDLQAQIRRTLGNLFLITPPPKGEVCEEEISRLINLLLLEFIDVVSSTIAPDT
jgi:hypothetical protein